MANAFGANANSSLETMLQLGAAQAVAGTQAAQSGVNAVLNGGTQIRSDTNAMRDQARLVNTQAGKVNMTADELAALATTLTPYADKLSGYGDDLSAFATSLTERSNDAFGQAGAIANMSGDATGLAAEYLDHYRSLSPDRYVSRAASDAQASAENAMAQSRRSLARRGVSAGSGAAGALESQYQRALAELTSTAKTKAWDAGNKAQGDFLSTMTNAAKTFYDMGSQGAQQSLAAREAAGTMQKGAAGIITSQGGMIADAGQLRSTAGSLFSNAASIFGSAAGIENSYLSLTESAYNHLANAFQAAANYYTSAAGVEVGANTRGGGGGSVTTSSSDFDPWEATGHDSTWWKNNLGTDDFTDMANRMATLAANRK